MPIRILMDEHVPRAVTLGLRLRGVDVQTAQELGFTGFIDELLLARATAAGRVLFSQDEDLLHIAAAWQREGRGFGGVVYSHQYSATISQIIHDLDLLAGVGRPADFENRVEYLPLK